MNTGGFESPSTSPDHVLELLTCGGIEMIAINILRRRFGQRS
jgi:hypothetical protein